MRIAFSALLVIFAVCARGEELLIREPQLTPTTGHSVRAVSSAHGALVIWSADYGGGGAALVPPGAASTTLPLPLPISIGRDVAIASDGEDYLVVEHSVQVVRGETGEVIASRDRWWTDIKPHALVWTGRAYLFLFQRARGVGNRPSHGAILLDRNGALTSGELDLGTTGAYGKAACAGRECLIVVSEVFHDASRVAVISDRDFPPTGTTRRVPMWPFFPEAKIIALAGNDDAGFAVVRLENARYLYQRLAIGEHGHAPVDAESPLRLARRAREVVLAGTAVEIAASSFDVKLSLHGESAYVASRDQVVRITGDDVTSVTVAEQAHEVSVVTAGSSAIAILRRAADSQIHAAPVVGDTIPAPTLRVSSAYVEMDRPRIASGGGVHLAVWLEGLSAAFRVLGSDGAPLSTTGSFPTDATYEVRVAASGTTFLIVWHTSGEREEIRGCVVGVDGTIIKPPFVISSGWGRSVPTSVVWHRGEYVVAAAGTLTRVTSDGRVLEELDDRSGQSIHLATDAGKLLAAWEELGEIICTCVPTVDYSIFEMDEDLRPRPLVGAHDGVISAGPVFMAGGGHYLLVWENYDRMQVAAKNREDYADYQLREIRDSYPYLDGAWTSREFVVTAGPRLAYHAPDGKLLRLEHLPAGTRHAAVTGHEDGVIVLMTRVLANRANVVVATRR